MFDNFRRNTLQPWGLTPDLPNAMESLNPLPCSGKPTLKYLCVAEKNDAAKKIAEILSNGNLREEDGHNMIYRFSCEVNKEPAICVMTSVTGHLFQYEFDESSRKYGWKDCDPVELFDAPVKKTCKNEEIRQNIQKQAGECEGLIIWTDCDREGENIGYEIMEVCREINPNISVHRAKYSDFSAESITRALQNLEQPNQFISDAVDVRQELDIKVGAAFTRMQTMLLQKSFPGVFLKTIKYGSGLIHTLGFVVERYLSRESFIPEDNCQIRLSHTKDLLTTDFTWESVVTHNKDEVEPLLKRCQLANCVKIERVVIKKICKPLPLETIEMEKTLSRRMQISAKEVMDTAQKLYISGYISYPRTGTNIFSNEMNLEEIVKQQVEDKSWGSIAQSIIDKESAPRQGEKKDGAHPPIHPTKYAKENKLSGNEKVVYEYIVRHFLACMHQDALVHEIVVEADCAGEKFTAKGLVGPNYLEVDKNWVNSAEKQIVEYKVGDIFVPSLLELGQVSKPDFLTEADLIALMDQHGIGTVGTHAQHIETIKACGYVVMHEGIYLKPEELGIGLIEGYNNMNLPTSLTKPDLRSDFEKDLTSICNGAKISEEVRQKHIDKYKEIFREVVKQKYEIVNALRPYANAQMANKIKCNCGHVAVQRTVSKEGPTIGRKFFNCPKQENQCKFFEWAI